MKRERDFFSRIIHKPAYRTTGGGSYLVVLSLTLFFIALMTFVLVAIGRGLEHAEDISTERRLILPILLFIPLPVLIAVIYNLAGMGRNMLRHKPGARIKGRLTLFFFVIAIISAAPQAYMSINLLRIMLNARFNGSVQTTINAGTDLAASYRSDRSQTLEGLGASDLLRRYLPQNEREATSFFKTFPFVTGVQFYGKKRAFYGDKHGFIIESEALLAAEGIQPVRANANAFILTYKAPVSLLLSNDRSDEFVVLTSVMPRAFYSYYETAKEGVRAAGQFGRFAFYLKAGLAFFYVLFSLPLILLAILSGFILANELVKPLVDLENVTGRVADGDYGARILGRPGNDLSGLVSAFNLMLSRLEDAREESAKAEKMAAWSEIAQSLAHEIKNPLTPIRLSAQRILKKIQEGSPDRSVIEPAMQTIIRESDQLTAMVDEFRSLSKPGLPVKTALNARELVEDAVSLFRTAYPGVSWNDEIPPEATLFADEKPMRAVLVNLIKNAVEAMKERGEMRFTYVTLIRNDRAMTRISVLDTGPGINEADLENVFTPYHTTKQEGVGLGLAVVQKAVFNHGGRIRAENRTGGGAAFIMDLPSS